MRTIVYVDGYNFYYGLLKKENPDRSLITHPTFKWLDLRGLVSEVLRAQDPKIELTAVRFFTADIKARLATRGKISAHAQAAYHRALEAKGVEVIRGSFTLAQSTLPRYVEGQGVDRNDRVKVWKLEEKQTDVQLCLEMYRDASAGRVDHVVLCTNDSDLAPALKAVRTDFPDIIVGVVLPRLPETKERRSESLEKFAHWTRRHIRPEELAAHQFPDRVGTGKKPVDRPEHW